MPDDPKIQTPAQMRHEAESLEKAAAAYLSRAKQLRAVAAAIEALRTMPIQAESISPLPARSHSGTIDSMDSTQIGAGASKRTRGVPLESNGPYAKVAKLLGVSLAEVGRRLDENVYTVRTWNARKHVPDGIQAKLDALVAAHQSGPKSPKRRGKV